MVRLNNNMNYNNCIANCKSLFPDSEAALVACINGCAKVNAPSDAGIFATEASQQIQEEVQKLGKREFLRKVQSAAKNAISRLPDSGELDKLDPVSRQYIERITNLIERGLKSSNWNDDEIARYAQDVSWGKLSSDIVVSFLARDNSGGGSGGPTCVTKCASEYDQCVSENGCDTSGWVCVCCVPCSLQYMGCVAKCSMFIGGFGGIAIA